MMSDILYQVFRFFVNFYHTVHNLYFLYFVFETAPTHKPVRRYFLSDDDEFDESYTRVPEDAVYIEEWIQDNTKKCRVLYEGEEIPNAWEGTPFDKKAKLPWIWVGDKETEIDLTKTFNKFVVPGNCIKLDLVEKLIQITENSHLIYIEYGTFEEIEFPGEGITIEEDAEARPVQTR